MATQETGLELVKRETPTLQALLALNMSGATDIHTIIQQEIEYLQMHLTLKPGLAACLPQSMLQAVKRAIKNNLSLDPSAGLVYLKPRSVNLAQQGQQDQWVRVLECTETANGLISIARQCGRILDIERPKVRKDDKGKIIAVSFRYLVPSTPSPRWEEVEFDESDFFRWRRASHKENSKGWKVTSGKDAPDQNSLNYANENYTNFYGGIDPEFARAKAIKHGLQKLGTNQNETRATSIQPDKKVVIETKGANAAADDESNGNGFSSFEEVSSTIPPAQTNQQEPGGLGATFNPNDL